MAVRILAFLAIAGIAHGEETIVTAKRGSYAISGLVAPAEETKRYKHGVALFAGSPGILRLRMEGGKPVFDLGGNFLVRSRRWWLDGETLTVVVDAPSDQWTTFEQRFRQTKRWGEDVAALLKEVAARYPVEDWTFVGTSEGVVSAFHAARMNPTLAKRLILTSSLFGSNRNGPGLSDAKWSAYPGRLLWVHHVDDPCSQTSYREAQAFAKKTNAPLVTIRGGGPEKGGACEAYSFHGFVGVEPKAVQAMSAWIRTGALP